MCVFCVCLVHRVYTPTAEPAFFCMPPSCKFLKFPGPLRWWCEYEPVPGTRLYFFIYRIIERSIQHHYTSVMVENVRVWILVMLMKSISQWWRKGGGREDAERSSIVLVVSWCIFFTAAVFINSKQPSWIKCARQQHRSFNFFSSSLSSSFMLYWVVLVFL